MIQPVQQSISPDRSCPVQSRSSSRNFWTGIGPIPDADSHDWACSGLIPHSVQAEGICFWLLVCEWGKYILVEANIQTEVVYVPSESVFGGEW